MTPGSGPASTGLTVTGDLSAIGGSSTQTFQASGNTFTFAAQVDATTSQGSKTIPISIRDDQGRTGALNISLTVTAPLANSTIVISQIYPGGGNSNATFTNDFVQLYNRGSATVDLTGWSLQYAPATGTGDWTGRQPLGGTIAPGQYYLISLASGGAVGSSLPPANVIGQINMGQSAGKVALVDNGDFLTDPSGCPTSPHIKDLVGYGTTANCFEGSGTAPAPTPTNQAALFRQDGGFIDTNDNRSDFVIGPPNPVSTAPIVVIPPSVFTTDPTLNGFDAPRDGTITVTFTEAVTLDPSWYDITCATTRSHDDATEAASGITHYVTPNVNFAAGEQCTVTVFKDKVHDADTGLLAPPSDYTWSFTVASGAAAPESADVHLLMGNPTDATADVNQPDNYLMSKPEYALSYDRALGRPNWVSWHLTTAWIPTNHPSRVDTFRPDPAVPADWYRVQSFDFTGSGFDRGHMTPNADRESSTPVNQATFLMSNMVAQSDDNNAGPWEDFENYLRSVVHGDPDHPNEIYIVSGPLGSGGTGSNGGVTTTLAGGHVTVPAYTWKVALVLPDDGAEDDISRVNCSTRTIAVVTPNTVNIKSDSWTKYLTTVAAVETLVRSDTTGGSSQFTLFSNLPQPIQNCIKAGVNGNNPQAQTITFPAIAPHAYGDSDFAVNATASSGLPVAIAVVSGPATINDGLVHPTGPGMVTIRATQAGNVDLSTPASVPTEFASAAPVDQSFAVEKGTPGFSDLAPSSIEAGTASTTVSGVIAVNGLVPTGSVTITLGTQGAAASIGAAGAFSASVATGTLTPAGSPYSISFSYAGDANFAPVSASSTMTATDTTPPVVSVTSVTVNQASAGGAVATFGATASDLVDGTLTPVCSPASGSTFPVGTTIVTCRATDAHGNTGTGTGTVTVDANRDVTIVTGQTVTFTRGVVTGNVRVNGGTLVLTGGSRVTGNLQVSGGTIALESSAITGNVQLIGGGAFSITGGTIGGNLQIQNLPSSVAASAVCGAAVQGNVQVQNNGTSITIGSAANCAGNLVGGNLQIMNNAAPIQVFGNTVQHNLQCGQNAALSGGANTAALKQGQCGPF
ncbi:MAG: DNA/RNA non-specific endonuclease [Vicinamibacterales bacterium]